MKLRLAFLFALACASSAQAILWIVPSRFSAPGGGGTCTQFDSQESFNDYQYLGSPQWQKVTNATARNICEVQLYIGNSSATTQSVHVEIWSDSARAGTKYGSNSDSVTIDQSQGTPSFYRGWWVFSWSGTKPNPSGDFYIHVFNDTGTVNLNMWSDTGLSSGSYGGYCYRVSSQ